MAFDVDLTEHNAVAVVVVWWGNVGGIVINL